MKIDDTYSIVLNVANEEDEMYGDIYDDYSECLKKHPNDRITFGYEIINEKTGLNAIEENEGIDEWYDFVEDAIWAWEKYLKGSKKKEKMKTLTFYAKANIYTRFDAEVTDEQYDEIVNCGEDPDDVIEDLDCLAHSALYNDSNRYAEIYEEYYLPEDEK